jgi:hypothetical protein
MLAVWIAKSPEFEKYIHKNMDCIEQLRGDVPYSNAMWGLPSYMYGYEIYVDDTVVENQYFWPDDVALFVPTQLLYKHLIGNYIDPSEITGFLMNGFSSFKRD